MRGITIGVVSKNVIGWSWENGLSLSAVGKGKASLIKSGMYGDIHSRGNWDKTSIPFIFGTIPNKDAW